MKCQNLFSGKNKNISKFRLMKFLPRTLSVKQQMAASKIIGAMLKKEKHFWRQESTFLVLREKLPRRGTKKKKNILKSQSEKGGKYFPRIRGVRSGYALFATTFEPGHSISYNTV